MTAKADKYHDMTNNTMAANANIEVNVIKIGQYLKIVKEKELFRYGGYDTFDLWRADNTSLKPQRANRYINIYNFFIEKHKLDPLMLCMAGEDKLGEVLKYCRKHPEATVQLVEKAQTYSLRDLINEIRTLEGKEEMKPKRPEVQPKGKTYRDWVKSKPCVLHNLRPADDYAHFPRSKTFGEFGMPLCRKCHDELHRKGVDFFFYNYSPRIGQYLDSTINLIEKGLQKEEK